MHEPAETNKMLLAKYSLGDIVDEQEEI